MTLIEKLNEAAAMSDAEMRSRKNAIPEVKALLAQAAAALDAQDADHVLIPRANIIDLEHISPEARRSLEDAIATNQAKPIISRDPWKGHEDDPTRPIPPHIEDTEGNEA